MIHTHFIMQVLSKEVSSTIFWVFGMIWPGIEPQSPRSLANTLPTRPMYHSIPNRRPDLVLINKKRNYHFIDFVIPEDYRIKIKESKKISWNLDLTRETVEYNGDSNTNFCWFPWNRDWENWWSEEKLKLSWL